MRKRISLFLMVLIAIVFLSTGCGSTASAKPNHNAPASRPTFTVLTDHDAVPPPGGDGAGTPSLRGVYKAPGFKVTIKKNDIIIYLQSQGYSGLYWKGTAPMRAGNGFFVSEADVPALNASIVGSQDVVKRFEADGKTVSFKFSMMGMNRAVVAKR